MSWTRANKISAKYRPVWRVIWCFTPSEPNGYYMNHHTPEIHILYCCVLYGCQDKRRVFPYTALTTVYITETERAYCAVRTEYINIIQVNFIVPRLRWQVAASHCGGLDSISVQSMCNLWLKKWHGTRLFCPYFGFHCQHFSTNAPYSFASTCYIYHKETRAKSGSHPKTKFVSKIRKH
jgi:hypothetical protein